MMRALRTHLALAATIAIGVAGITADGHAQSLLASQGLGMPLEPIGARAAGLGAAPLGLIGDEFVWADPSLAARLGSPGLMLSFQQDAFDGTFADGTADGSTSRFPLLFGAVPVARNIALFAGVGGFLDQHWAVEQPDTLLIGPDSVAIIDRFQSEGGVARLRLGAAGAVADEITISAGVDVYTGTVRRNAGRLFGTSQISGCCAGAWDYRGVGFFASAGWSRDDAFRLAASVEVGGTLDAEPDDSIANPVEFDMPVAASLGGSARVSTNLLLSASGRWGGWADLDAPLTAVGGAVDSWAATGGVEWDGIRIAGRPLPLRLGARTGRLPFRWDGGEIDERAVTGGTGIVLAGGAAQGDIAVERGSRSGDAFEEDYWRFQLSIRLLGR